MRGESEGLHLYSHGRLEITGNDVAWVLLCHRAMAEHATTTVRSEAMCKRVRRGVYGKGDAWRKPTG
jgi:hypothetical protein